MSHLATLNEYRFHEEADDIRGATLYGESGKKIARIKDVLLDHHSGDIVYFIADTGHNRRVMLPLNRISRSGTRDDSFSSNLTSRDLERLPIFDDRMLVNEDLWRNYERLYRSVLEELVDTRHDGVSPARKNVTAIDSWKPRNSRGVNPELSSRLRGFQQHVRQNLHRIQSECENCTDKRRQIA